MRNFEKFRDKQMSKKEASITMGGDSVYCEGGGLDPCIRLSYSYWAPTMCGGYHPESPASYYCRLEACNVAIAECTIQ